MKVRIDLEAKTVTLLDNVSMNDLQELLKKLDKDSDGWTVISDNITECVPIHYIYQWRPYRWSYESPIFTETSAGITVL